MAFLAPLLAGAGGAGAAGAAGAATAAPSALGIASQLAVQPSPPQPLSPLFGGMQLQAPQVQQQGQDFNNLSNFFASLSQPKQPTEQQAIQAKVGGFMPQ